MAVYNVAQFIYQSISPMNLLFITCVVIGETP